MKKLLLLIVLIAYSTSMFSQLYVKPNGATDSYVYVKDEILFVEQDVNLEVNSVGTTNASLYLREGAQLIQGSTVDPTGSINDGDGKLSVYQNAPDSDRWTYNYWCSPVGNENIVGTGNKNFGLYRLYDIQDETDSDVTLRTTGYNGSSPPLTISTRWMYIHLRGDEVEGDYTRINANDAVNPGYGFLMKGVGTTPVDINGNGTQDPDDGFEYDFRGRPHNGDLDIDVFDSELTLSGNPYPSALDLNRVFWDSDNSEITSFKYWDEDKDRNSHYYSQNAGGYGTYVPGASDPNGYNGSGGFEPGIYTVPTFSIWDAAGNSTATGTNGLPYERRFSPIGQGFMIVPDGSDDQIVTIKNSHRRYIKEGAGNNSEFRTPGDDATIGIDPGDPDPIPYIATPLLRINTYFGTSHIRQMALAFSDQSTNGFDRGQDGRHPMDAVGAEVYFPIEYNGEKTPFVIQTIPFDINATIPVTFKLNSFPEVVVKAIEKINFNEEAYLVDRQKGTFKQITNGYKAVMVLDAGEYKDRFYIVFKSRRETNETSEGTIVKEETRANVDFFQNNPSKQLEILNPEGYNIKSALIYDMAGKLVINKTNLGNQNNITLSTSNVADGIYLVQLTTSENINIDYKMVIKNN